MEKQSGSPRTLVTVLCTAAVTALLTLAAVYAFAPFERSDYEAPVGVVSGMPERLNKMHHNGVTALRTLGQDTCLLVVGDTAAAARSQRTLSISSAAIAPATAAKMFGRRVANFCAGKAIHTARAQTAHGRQRRQDVEVTPLDAQNKGIRPSNGCQNKNLVDCNDGNAVYECNTGTGEIYKASIECKKPTEFTLSLVPRCNDFGDTKGVRFIKCLQKFILGQQGGFIAE